MLPVTVKNAATRTPHQNNGTTQIDQGMLWPNLPRDSFAAVGAGKQSIWVDREHDLIVVQSPGTFDGSFSPAACGEVSERVLSTLA